MTEPKRIEQLLSSENTANVSYSPGKRLVGWVYNDDDFAYLTDALSALDEIKRWAVEGPRLREALRQIDEPPNPTIFARTIDDLEAYITRLRNIARGAIDRIDGASKP